MIYAVYAGYACLDKEPVSNNLRVIMPDYFCYLMQNLVIGRNVLFKRKERHRPVEGSAVKNVPC